MKTKENTSTAEIDNTLALSLDVDLDSVAIQRLIDEVRTGDPITTSAYNRTYNRHNR